MSDSSPDSQGELIESGARYSKGDEPSSQPKTEADDNADFFFNNIKKQIQNELLKGIVVGTVDVKEWQSRCEIVPGIFIDLLHPDTRELPLSQSPFGYKRETLIDLKVRDCKELSLSQCDRQLRLLAQGIVGDGKYCEPYKLVVYEEGGHFDQHTDTPQKGLVESLVFHLPTECEGGELMFQSWNPAEHFKANSINYVLFKINHPHRVTRVTKGKKISLLFKVFDLPDFKNESSYFIPASYKNVLFTYPNPDVLRSLLTRLNLDYEVVYYDQTNQPPREVFEYIEDLSDMGSDHYIDLLTRNPTKFLVEHVVDLGSPHMHADSCTRHYGWTGNDACSESEELKYCKGYLVNSQPENSMSILKKDSEYISSTTSVSQQGELIESGAQHSKGDESSQPMRARTAADGTDNIFDDIKKEFQKELKEDIKVGTVYKTEWQSRCEIIPGIFIDLLHPDTRELPLSQSPFGNKRETFVDLKVRDCKELSISQCDRQLRLLAQRIVGAGKYCEPYKLVVHEEGGHFDQHTDTPQKGQVESLVFYLPTECEGGELMFQSWNPAENFKANAINYVLFKVNHPHRVTRVTKGKKILLLFKVFLPNQREWRVITYSNYCYSLIDIPASYKNVLFTYPDQDVLQSLFTRLKLDYKVVYYDDEEYQSPTEVFTDIENVEDLSNPGYDYHSFRSLTQNATKFLVEHLVDLGTCTESGGEYSRYYGWTGNNAICETIELNYSVGYLVNPQPVNSVSILKKDSGHISKEDTKSISKEDAESISKKSSESI